LTSVTSSRRRRKEEADHALALAVRRAGRPPQPREVGRQGEDAPAVLVVERRPIRVPLPRVFLLRIGEEA
jgi:hypothetical protein